MSYDAYADRAEEAKGRAQEKLIGGRDRPKKVAVFEPELDAREFLSFGISTAVEARLAASLLGRHQKKVVKDEAARGGRTAGLEQTSALLNGLPEAAQLRGLPGPAWLLRLRFQLEQPLTTRGDWAATPAEMAFRRDRALGVPMVAASGWKGALSAACEGLGVHRRKKDAAADATLTRLLGVFAVNEDQPGAAGHLHFFPTVFDPSRLGTAILSPQDRAKRKGKDNTLVDFEIITAESEGDFGLLWFAHDWDWPGGDWGEQAREELQLSCRAVAEMFRRSGFGARVSSGYGTANDKLVGEGEIWTRLVAADEPLRHTFASFTELENLRWD